MKRLTATFFALILTICLAAPAAFASETDAEDTGLFEESYFSETELYSGTSTLPQNAALSTSGVPANENSEYELPVITSAGEVISFPDETETSGTEEERKKMVLIGDSYAAGYNPEGDVAAEKKSWPLQLAAAMGTEDSIISAKTGSGFANTYQGYNFLILLDKALELSDDPQSVEQVIVCGGFNDRYQSYNDIYNNVRNFIAKARTYFPNAKVFVGMDGWSTDITSQELIQEKVVPAYRQAALDSGSTYIAGLEYALANNTGSISSDGVHPSLSGQTHLADCILKYNNAPEESEDRVLVRFHKNLDGEDEVQEAVYTAESELPVLTEIFTPADQELLGWSFYQNPVRSSYITDAETIRAWISGPEREVDLYAVWKKKGDSYTGIRWMNGNWYWVENGAVNWNYSGFAEHEGGLLYLYHGVYNNTFNSVERAPDGKWYRVSGGRIDFSYTGIAQNANGWWYVKDGIVDFSYNGIIQSGEEIWRIKGGRIDFNMEGLEAINGTWWFFKRGRVDKAYAGIVQNQYGWWRVINGTVDFTCNSVEQNEFGWWKLKNGKVDFSYTGVAKNAYGWWRIVNGKVDFGCNSVEKNEYGWWYIRSGKVDFEYTGIAQNAYGWWRIVKGQVDFSCNSVEQNSGGWWYIKSGKVDFSYTGLGQNAYGWWYIKGGKVDFSYSGLVQNAYGWWYVKGGKVDFSYSGPFAFNGRTYQVVKGKVQ